MIYHRYSIDFERDWNCLLDPELAEHPALVLRTRPAREPHNHTLSDTRRRLFPKRGTSHNGGGDKIYAGSFLSFVHISVPRVSVVSSRVHTSLPYCPTLIPSFGSRSSIPFDFVTSHVFAGTYKVTVADRYLLRHVRLNIQCIPR